MRKSEWRKTMTRAEQELKDGNQKKAARIVREELWDGFMSYEDL